MLASMLTAASMAGCQNDSSSGGSSGDSGEGQEGTTTVNFYGASDMDKTAEAEIEAFMKENENTKVSICGYADKKTGNANINLRLSEKRAEAVAAALKEKGIAENRIEMNYKGDTEQPFSVNEENRVTICIAAE